MEDKFVSLYTDIVDEVNTSLHHLPMQTNKLRRCFNPNGINQESTLHDFLFNLDPSTIFGEGALDPLSTASHPRAALAFGLPGHGDDGDPGVAQEALHVLGKWRERASGARERVARVVSGMVDHDGCF